jgi:hypothetical protein
LLRKTRERKHRGRYPRVGRDGTGKEGKTVVADPSRYQLAKLKRLKVG